MKTLFTRRMLVVGGVLVAVCAIGIAAVVKHAQAAEGDYRNRVTLARDIAKLAIVVMANQTPITADDAKAILPVLEDIRAEDVITEEEAAQLDAALWDAFSSELTDAVSVVRLPEARPEVRQRMLQLAERRQLQGNPAKHGPASHAFDRLIEFFEMTAAQ